ncbi:MAG: serine hydrolase domain-containing protein [Zymomonas mobilis]|uniref:CubicO group peptidase (Beta-lactamase class C family) n=1 Tax=Zymomonas mobilis TaxID=542 RepID=A0A542W306_ZYMMB|nr:serine hydrolase domain-containing protein [Zymomonas mobilis]TQL17953.1 CubicO group peptidase (beta-lactamase class C family) [Zymomonas mobilis]
MTSNLSGKLDEIIQQSLDQQRLVGCVLIIAHKGRVVYQKAAGWKDRENRQAMAIETSFRLSSVTKPLVTAAVLRLVEEGKISLDTPVTRWLPYFRPKVAGQSEAPVITLHHLLTHQSGLNYGFLLPQDSIYHRLDISDGIDFRPTCSLEENMHQLAKAPLFYHPGKGWGYSLAIDVIGAMLEKLCKRPLPAIIEDYVTKPLGLQSCRFWAHSDELAVPYYNAKPIPKKMGALENYGGVLFSPRRAEEKSAYPSGGAGMIGNAPDLIRFFEVLRTGESRFLSQATRERMFTNHVSREISTDKPGFGFGYGGSLIIDPKIVGSGQSEGTMQWGGVYGHRWFIDPTREITAVSLTNTGFEGMNGAYPEEITKAIYQSIDQ